MKLKLLAAALAGSVISANATSLQPLSLDDVVEASTMVVVGEAVSARTERTDQGVFTYTEFQVSDAVVGATDGRVTITTLGGRYKSGKFKLAETWPGSPMLVNGSRMMLFLQDSAVGNFEIVGFSQGALPVSDSSQGEVVRSPGGGVVPLHAMKDRVKNIKSKGRGPKLAD